MTADRMSIRSTSVSETDLTALPEQSTTDLNREVAALSNKLVNATNHQTLLGDSLASTKHELEISKARVQQLEALARQHADMMAKGLLAEKKTLDSETQKLTNKLKEKSRQREKTEKDKKTIEQEMENLTAALFGEANNVGATLAARDARG
ncbi:rab guanine nucleotide exchange factor S2 [Rhizina undulata]